MHAVLLEPRFLSPLDGRSLPSPRTSECFTPPRSGMSTGALQRSTSWAVYARQNSLSSQSSYSKQLSGTSQGSHSCRLPLQQSMSLQSQKLQKQPTFPSRTQSSSTVTGSAVSQASSPSATSGGSRASLRERMPEAELVQELRELKESLKIMTMEQSQRSL